MLPLDDPKWKTLCGGYKVAYDPSNSLAQLWLARTRPPLGRNCGKSCTIKATLVTRPMHQFRISFKFKKKLAAWIGTPTALIATIEIERHRQKNPPIPDWLLPSYEFAWHDLLAIALRDYVKTTDRLTARAILGVLALCKGLQEIGTIVSYFDDSEIKEIFDSQLG
jgi:hypothetical protein